MLIDKAWRLQFKMLNFWKNGRDIIRARREAL